MSKILRHLGWLGALIFLLTACAPSPPPPRQVAAENSAAQAPEARKNSPPADAVASASSAEEPQLPIRFQQPDFVINDSEGAQVLKQDNGAAIKVGADISSTSGPVPLRNIMKRLAALKNMNLSWASDVDQYVPVDVDIRADDDFFTAIDHLLRQVDYFCKVQGNTIVVKYKETKIFHLAMPFISSTYSTGVGGDVLGGATGGSSNGNAMVGNLQLLSKENKFNVWKDIRNHLDQILQIWSQPTPQSAPTTASGSGAASTAGSGKTAAQPVHPARQSGKGYYSIDEPVGLITVTAPRPIIKRVASYLTSLKKQLYRQVSIEAKILEVDLNNNSSTGVDWSKVLSSLPVNFQLFGPQGILYSASSTATLGRVVQEISTPGNPFQLVLSALEQQGRTKVLANPKISVMNGQPALISVGNNQRFIDKITSNANEGGVVTYTVTTANIMSGIALSVVPTIMDDGQIILNMAPVTSQLDPNSLQEVQIGQGAVMLPKVSLREMNTTVRIKNGGMLVVGGLINNQYTTNHNKVPILSDLPGIGHFFTSTTKSKTRQELVILLRPQII